jgi:hypothetical protein
MFQDRLWLALGNFKPAHLQKMNRLLYGRPVAHEEWMCGVNGNVVGHAG